MSTATTRTAPSITTQVCWSKRGVEVGQQQPAHNRTGDLSMRRFADQPLEPQGGGVRCRRTRRPAIAADQASGDCLQERWVGAAKSD